MPPPAIIVGLDLSLSRPAACCIDSDWEIGNWKTVSYVSWKTAPVSSLADRHERLCWIRDRVLEFCFDERDATHIWIEGYAFAAQSSSVTKLAELGGVVRVALHEHGIDAVPVPSTSCRKLLLGKVPRKGAKVAVQRALYDAGAPFDDDDQCDAMAVVNFGLSELGYTAMTLTRDAIETKVVSQ